MDARLRTDESFAQMYDYDHHRIVSPLTELNFGLVTRFSLDYMHLVCIGVIWKIVFLWLFGPTKIQLQSNAINHISSRLFFEISHSKRICKKA